jgi:uncharacterized protein UPF0175
MLLSDILAIRCGLHPFENLTLAAGGVGRPCLGRVPRIRSAITGATQNLSCYGFVATVAYAEVMRIWLDLPDDFVEQLAEKGQDLSKASLEALAIDAYRMNRISGYQLGQLLEIPSRYELDGFLKHHGVPLEYTIEDFERESATSARLRQKRQEELAAQRDRRPE